jgi:hypothetical protein
LIDFISGQLDADEYSSTWLGLVYIVSYVVIVVILLLNLLVAEMGDTYSKGIDHADRSWLLERARIIFSIEHELSEEERLEEVNRYWITIGGKRFIQVEEIDENWGKDEEERDQMQDIMQQLKDLSEKVESLENRLSQQISLKESRGDSSSSEDHSARKMTLRPRTPKRR